MAGPLPSPSGLIELRLQSLEQLFDPFDPFPIPTRDLAKGAEEFVVGWARDLPRNAALGLRVYLPPESAASADVAGLGSAISSHFLYRAGRTEGDVRELLAIGQVSLLIGLGVLGACIALRQVLRDLMPQLPFATFFTEGLVIVGWVANWRPIEIFLYEWWPLARRKRLFLRLAAAPIEIVSSVEAAPVGHEMHAMPPATPQDS